MIKYKLLSISISLTYRKSQTHSNFQQGNDGREPNLEIPHIGEIGEGKQEKKNTLREIRRSNTQTSAGEKEYKTKNLVEVDRGRNMSRRRITTLFFIQITRHLQNQSSSIIIDNH